MTKIYRGLRLNDVPPELQEFIRRHLRIPYDESEVGQHFRIGPALLDHIENSHWEQGRDDFAGYDTANLGRNWTLDRSWAEKAGSPNTGPCWMGVLLEADMPTNPDAFDPKNNNEDIRNVESEKQVTPIPGAPLNVTGVKIRDGQEWREVLNDPEYVARRSKEYPSILQHHTGPQVRIAMTEAGDYADYRWREAARYFFSVGATDKVLYDFTGSPETQYHHRQITPETVKDIGKRENNIDAYYEEMHQRREQGLSEIPWNEWLDRIAYIRNAMAWQDWAPHVRNDFYNANTNPADVGHHCEQGGCTYQAEENDERAASAYWIDHGHGNGGSFLTFNHLPGNRIAVGVLDTDIRYRRDGVAEAMLRRLVEDHPGAKIIPGNMTPPGKKFHDRMLEKEPEAKALVTANSLLVGPEDAYDEWDWFRRHQEHPPSSIQTEHETWYHVSPHRIPEGTTLAPMRGETPWNDEPYDHGLQNRANWIWVEYDKDKARAWMHYILQHQPEAFIYRVQPDIGPFAWNGTADEGWVTNRAVVVEFLDQISHDLSFQEHPR